MYPLLYRSSESACDVPRADLFGAAALTKDPNGPRTLLLPLQRLSLYWLSFYSIAVLAELGHSPVDPVSFGFVAQSPPSPRLCRSREFFRITKYLSFCARLSYRPDPNCDRAGPWSARARDRGRDAESGRLRSTSSSHHHRDEKCTAFLCPQRVTPSIRTGPSLVRLPARARSRRNPEAKARGPLHRRCRCRLLLRVDRLGSSAGCMKTLLSVRSGMPHLDPRRPWECG